MKLEELKKREIKVSGDLVAFIWIKPKLKSGILIPNKYYNLGLQLGKHYLGKVIAIGSKVKQLKLEDTILVAEYGIKDFRGGWKENEIYFIEEHFIKAIVTGFKGLIEDINIKRREKDVNRPAT